MKYKDLRIITKEYKGKWYLDIKQDMLHLGNGIIQDPGPLIFKQAFNSKEEAESFGLNYLKSNNL